MQVQFEKMQIRDGSYSRELNHSVQREGQSLNADSEHFGNPGFLKFAVEGMP